MRTSAAPELLYVSVSPPIPCADGWHRLQWSQRDHSMIACPPLTLPTLQNDTMRLTRLQARQLDHRAMHDLAIPGIVLMENAGRSMADLLLHRLKAGPVVVCCGKGNNGGDGFVIARHLAIAGVPVRVLLFSSPDAIEGDAALNLQILHRCGLPVEVHNDETGLPDHLAHAEWIVDALFGTGLTGPPRPPMDRVIDTINAANRPVLAVDCPSGLDINTGQPFATCIRAHLTATVVAPKVGFDAPYAQAYLGEVVVVGMGVPAALLAPLDS